MEDSCLLKMKKVSAWLISNGHTAKNGLLEFMHNLETTQYYAQDEIKTIFGFPVKAIFHLVYSIELMDEPTPNAVGNNSAIGTEMLDLQLAYETSRIVENTVGKFNPTAEMVLAGINKDIFRSVVKEIYQR